MEKNRENNTISCLDTVLQEVRRLELTQQLKLSDAMPDIGRILSCWGQVIVRGKEWDSEEVTVNGGLLVWVLYAPEDGSQERCLDSWIPFQMKWELPENVPEGTLRVRCLQRFADGRSVSPRKILLRCGISALAEGFVPVQRQVQLPEKQPEVEMLESVYPLRLPVEAGEKVFLLDEDLTLPDSAPQPEKLIYSRLQPKLTDCRILADKLAFRGNGELHVLYRSEEGRLHSWDFPLPFSQVAELEGEYSSDAQMDMAFAVTSMETELDEEGHIRFKGGITAQYRITDQELLSVVEDAYSPDRELQIHTQELELPVVLENRRETLFGEQTLPVEAEQAADVSFLPDFPRQRQREQGLELENQGSFQVLYYDPSGQLQSANAKWEDRQQLKADENALVTAIAIPGEVQLHSGGGQLHLKAELPMELTTTAKQLLPMVTEVEPGQLKQRASERPSVILRRAGGNRLWDIAKESGSRVDKIRSANGLQGEPAPDQLLLIPVG